MFTFPYLVTPCLRHKIWHSRSHQTACLQHVPSLEVADRLSLRFRTVMCHANKVSDSVSDSQKNRNRKKKSISAKDSEMEDLMKIVELLPKHLRKRLESHPELRNLLEVVMDLGRIPFARFPNGDFDVSKSVVSQDDLAFAITQLGEFGGDSRAGISGTLHRISCMRNRKGEIIGLTARVGRDITGSGEIVADIIRKGKSLLLLGHPGRGKTTAIRSMCKILADHEQKRVVIVDTSNEIGGDGDVPHPGIGKARRMQVAHPDAQHAVMIEAVENHMPQVVVIDEIGRGSIFRESVLNCSFAEGTEEECEAAATIAQRGVQLIATAHGTGLESVVKNPQLQALIGGIESVTLGDIEARKRGVQKTVLERSAPPAFDVAVEMVECNIWRIHDNLAEAIDTILAGSTAHGEIRTRTESGTIETEPIQTPDPVINAVPISEPEPEKEEEDIILHNEDLDEEMEEYDPNTWSGDAEWDFFHNAAPFTGIESTPSATSTNAMRLFLIGVEAKHLYNILEALGLKGQIAVTPYLKQANAVLGTRPDLRQAEWVEKTARGAGIPLFSLQSSSNMSLAKAIQSLLGLSPSTTLSYSKKPKKQTDSTPVTIKQTTKHEHALDEVELAITDIVLPRKQPADLLPQILEVIEMQIQVVEKCELEYKVVGEGDHTRLRIFPPGFVFSE